MSLDVWFASDVRRIIKAVLVSFEQAHDAHQEGNVEYQRGIREALYAIAVAFGIEAEGEQGRC